MHPGQPNCAAASGQMFDRSLSSVKGDICRTAARIPGIQQVQLGLSSPSQHFLRPPEHPHTPPWCEQQPDCRASPSVANVALEQIGVAAAPTDRSAIAANRAFSMSILPCETIMRLAVGSVQSGTPRYGPETKCPGCSLSVPQNRQLNADWAVNCPYRCACQADMSGLVRFSLELERPCPVIIPPPLVSAWLRATAMLPPANGSAIARVRGYDRKNASPEAPDDGLSRRRLARPAGL